MGAANPIVGGDSSKKCQSSIEGSNDRTGSSLMTTSSAPLLSSSSALAPSKSTESMKLTASTESSKSGIKRTMQTASRPDEGLSRRRRWLVVDFDGTCTEHDTTPLLPKLAHFVYRTRTSSSSSSLTNDNDTTIPQSIESISETSNNPNHLHHQQDLEHRLSQFQILEEEFMKRYGEAQSSIFQLLEKEYNKNHENYKTIHDILDALDEPSNVVTQMVSESRVLHGLGNANAEELEDMLHLHGVTTMMSGDGVKGVKEIVKSANNITIENDNVDNIDTSQDKVVVRLRHGCESTLARLLSEYSTNAKTGGGSQSNPSNLSSVEELNSANDPNATSFEQSQSLKCLGWSLAVLSINWCPALIDASLVRPVLRKRESILKEGQEMQDVQGDRMQHDINDEKVVGANGANASNGANGHAPHDVDIPIWSNHVDGEGYVTLHVPGALAKRDRILELRSRLNRRMSTESPLETGVYAKSMIVYVGDSSTDLAALLEADIGIIMGNSKSTLKIAERWGIQIFPLQHRSTYGMGSSLDAPGGVSDPSEEKKKQLWQVESWQEIDDLLKELDQHWE